MLSTGYRCCRFFGVNNLDLFADFGLGFRLGLYIGLFFNLLVGFGHRRGQKTGLEVEPDP